MIVFLTESMVKGRKEDGEKNCRLFRALLVFCVGFALALGRFWVYSTLDRSWGFPKDWWEIPVGEMIRQTIALWMVMVAASLSLTACSSSQPPAPTHTRSSTPIRTATWMPTATSTANPTSTPTSTPTKTHTATPTVTSTSTHTPRPTHTPQPTLTYTPVDPDAESTVKLIADALEQADIRGFEQLAYHVVVYGLYKSDAQVKNYAKAEFLSQIRLRLASHPQCAGYTFVTSPPNAILWIFTTGWDPEWKGPNHTFSDMVFELQSHGGGNFHLIGAYPNSMPSLQGESLCP